MVDIDSDHAVKFMITAFSRPGEWITHLAGPVGRAVQKAGTNGYLKSLQRFVDLRGLTAPHRRLGDHRDPGHGVSLRPSLRAATRTVSRLSTRTAALSTALAKVAPRLFVSESGGVNPPSTSTAALCGLRSIRVERIEKLGQNSSRVG